MIRIGTAGTAGKGYPLAFEDLKKASLSALEVEFTYGVRMSVDEAKNVGALAKKAGIALSVHAPFYINLASKEKAKVDASVQRIISSCKRAHLLNASPVVYHSGFFQDQDKKLVRQKIIENTVLIQDKIKELGYNTRIAPELTGKPSQFGSIPELLDLSKETGCGITIDFAHQKARQQGSIDYEKVFDQISSLKHIHAHFSGINWTEKGEKSHKITEKQDFLPLAKEIVKRKVDITVINESPQPFEDALMMKQIIDKLNK